MPASGVSLKSIIEGATLGKAFCLKCLLVLMSLQCRSRTDRVYLHSPNSTPAPLSGAGSCPLLGGYCLSHRGTRRAMGATLLKEQTDINRFWKVHPNVLWPKPFGISLISSWHKLELHRREEPAQKRSERLLGEESASVWFYWLSLLPAGRGPLRRLAIIDPHRGNNQITSFLIKLPSLRPFSSPAPIPEVRSWEIK